jgi:queuine tRNA-ribosyltransferase
MFELRFRNLTALSRQVFPRRTTMDRGPIEENCRCPACREFKFTRGYIRHLIKAEEILGLRLVTLHNLHFYLDLMRQAREKIERGAFESFRQEFVANYRTRDVDMATL